MPRERTTDPAWQRSGSATRHRLLASGRGGADIHTRRAGEELFGPRSEVVLLAGAVRSFVSGVEDWPGGCVRHFSGHPVVCRSTVSRRPIRSKDVTVAGSPRSAVLRSGPLETSISRYRWPVWPKHLRMQLARVNAVVRRLLTRSGLGPFTDGENWTDAKVVAPTKTSWITAQEGPWRRSESSGHRSATDLGAIQRSAADAIGGQICRNPW